MSVLTRSVDAAAVAAQLDSDGFVTLENVIDPAWIERAAAHIHALVAQKGERYFSVSWAARQKATPAAEIVDDPRMRCLLEELVRSGQPKARTDDEIYNAYRIVAGNQEEEGIVEAYHYDSYVITAVVPILIPPGEPRRSGELIVFPNRRGWRSSALVNMAEKALVQSAWFQKRVSRTLPSGPSPQIKVLRPGNVYLFWGYRTYHANFPVHTGNVRATMLLHLGDPHPGNALLNYIKRRNVDKQRQILAPDSRADQ
jgi:hypothetical protein